MKTNEESKVNNNKVENLEAPFTLTFGREETQFFKELFDTTPNKIREIKMTQVKESVHGESTQGQFSSNRPHSNFKIRRCINNDELQEVKEKLSKITSEIKTIESRQNEEINVSTKRVEKGNKDLEMEKSKLTLQNSKRNRCQSSLGFRMISEFQYENDENLETARFKEPRETVHKNKFSSKRLNVLIRRKSLVGKNKEKESHPKEHFMFFDTIASKNLNNEMYKENDENDLGCNKISMRKQKSIREKQENKKHKYDQYLMKKEVKVLGEKAQNGQECVFQIVLPEDENETKRKISLSNFISQYNTENMEYCENIFHLKKNISKPLKEIFKNKFSTIEKNSQHEDPFNMEKVVFNMRKRKHSLLSKKENKENENFVPNNFKISEKSVEKKEFKRYNEIDKENLFL